MFLVTGGTGFIGKRVVAQLLQKNIQVIATDINTDNEKDSFEKYLSFKGVSINDLKLLELDISERKNETKIRPVAITDPPYLSK